MKHFSCFVHLELDSGSSCMKYSRQLAGNTIAFVAFSFQRKILHNSTWKIYHYRKFKMLLSNCVIFALLFFLLSVGLWKSWEIAKAFLKTCCVVLFFFYFWLLQAPLLLLCYFLRWNVFILHAKAKTNFLFLSTSHSAFKLTRARKISNKLKKALYTIFQLRASEFFLSALAKVKLWIKKSSFNRRLLRNISITT